MKNVKIAKDELFKEGLVRNKQDAKNLNTNTVNIKEGSCYSPVNNSSTRCVYEETVLLKHLQTSAKKNNRNGKCDTSSDEFYKAKTKLILFSEIRQLISIQIRHKFYMYNV